MSARTRTFLTLDHAETALLAVLLTDEIQTLTRLRNGTLLLFWMGQRKGLYFWSEVSVCRADEANVRAFLQTRFDHLMRLWAPITQVHT